MTLLELRVKLVNSVIAWTNMTLDLVSVTSYLGGSLITLFLLGLSEKFMHKILMNSRLTRCTSRTRNHLTFVNMRSVY